MIKKNGNVRPNVKQTVRISLGKISVENDGFILSLNNLQDYYFDKTQIGIKSCLTEIENFLSMQIDEGEKYEK